MSVPAVQGCTITYSVDGGTVSVVSTVSPASSKTSSGGNKFYHDKITIAVNMGTSVVLSTPPASAASGSGTLTTPGTITIDASTQKATTSGKGFVCKGDEGSATFTFAFPAASGTGTVPGSVEITAKVSDASQNVVNAT